MVQDNIFPVGEEKFGPGFQKSLKEIWLLIPPPPPTLVGTGKPTPAAQRVERKGEAKAASHIAEKGEIVGPN